MPNALAVFIDRPASCLKSAVGTKKALTRRADTRLVALRPHRLTTLPGKQVGVGVSPSLDDVVILHFSHFKSSLKTN
jgi:hypothetical protein